MIEARGHGDVTQIMMRPDIDAEPVFWVSSYYTDGLLIDTGSPLNARELMTYLEGSDIRAVVNTHHHEDHIGANTLVSERFGVPIFAHPDAVPLIADPPELPWYRDACWGSPSSSTTVPVPDVIETDNYRFLVVETPGHCNGHISLVEQHQGWCFSGDLYVGQKMTVAGDENNVEDMVASMERLLSLSMPRMILFTSMRLVEPNGAEALRGAVTNFRDLSRRARALSNDGLSVTAIRDVLLGGPNPLDSVTNGRYSTENLIRQCLEADI